MKKAARQLGKQSHANSRAWKISSIFGVEAPAERDFTAAMQCMEDGERQRYGRGTGSLRGLLLLDQVGLIRDGRHAGCRTVLSIKS